MSVIENLHKRVSQLSMVVVEITRALVPNKSSSSFKNEETEQAKQAIMGLLMK